MRLAECGGTSSGRAAAGRSGGSRASTCASTCASAFPTCLQLAWLPPAAAHHPALCPCCGQRTCPRVGGCIGGWVGAALCRLLSSACLPVLLSGQSYGQSGLARHVAASSPATCHTDHACGPNHLPPTHSTTHLSQPPIYPSGVRKECRVNGKTILLFWYRNQIYAIEAR